MTMGEQAVVSRGAYQDKLPYHCTNCPLQLLNRRFKKCPVCGRGRIVFNPRSGCDRWECYTINNYHALGKGT